MTRLLSHRLALLSSAEHTDLLRQCRHGLEKESLRVDRQGQLALTPHAPSLGSALTHAQITTDYSEALLEFITAAREQPAETLDELDAIHRYVYAKLDDELLWCQSMPCKLPDEATIPIAQYGNSHIGQIKYVYRKGLAVRYGKAMQCIAGIHYNFSLPDALWQLLQRDDGDTQSARDYQSARYIALIRNFRRYNWLLMYLFGASPAVSSDFLRGRAHNLEAFDADTLYLPWATSLRMSGLGYQSDAQSSIQPCYNCLDSYLDNLREAVSTPYPPYQVFGTHRDGEWLQLNTNVLQIENEYYSSIRPKRVTHPGERPIQALGARGVQYVEVRCMDIDPFLPLGLDLGTARFVDTFLLYCALDDSPKMSSEECSEITDNLTLAVTEGRRPGLTLNEHGNPRTLTGWGQELLERMAPCAVLLDKAYGNIEHQQALSDASAKLKDADLTPSARMLHSMRKDNIGFLDFALRESARHADWFRTRPLDPPTLQAFEQAARDSIARQADIEHEQQGAFSDYVASYMAAINPIE